MCINENIKELEQFYKDNDIVYTCDGIGNCFWSYKDVTIAYAYDDEEFINVYFHWFVDKRNCGYYNKPRICGLLKKHGKFYDLDGVNTIEESKGQFRNVHDDLERFKYTLLTSRNLLAKRLQVLKGKVTMNFNNLYKDWSVHDCLYQVSYGKYLEIFSKQRDNYKIKLLNGCSYKIIQLENGKYVLFDNDYVYIIESSTYFKLNPSSHYFTTITKLNKNELKIIGDHL